MKFKLLIILLFLLSISACMKCIIDPPSQAVRDEFGCIGVTTNASTIAVTGRQPPKGGTEGALRSTGEVTLGTVGQLGPIGIVLLPITVPIAAIYGALKARPAEDVDIANNNLISAIKEDELAAMLQERIIIRANDKTKFHLVPLITKDEIPEKLRTIDDYLKLKVDAHWGLIGNFDPEIALSVTVFARIERERDNSCLLARRWIYISQPKKYFDTALSGTKLLKSEVEMVIDKLAEKIVNDIFISTAPEVQKDVYKEKGFVQRICIDQTEQCPTGQTYRNPFEPNKVYNTVDKGAFITY